MLDPNRVQLGVSLAASWPLGLPEPRQLIRLARRVEELGFASLWTGDHVVMYSPILDSLTTLGAFAAVTERVTLGTGVYLLGLRQPVQAAKSFASLDFLSGGRLVFGVGVGGEIATEWQASGVPVNERGPRVDEGLRVMRALWAGAHVSHHGRFWSFDDVSISPLPAQPGGPPIIVGGRSEAALRRAARHDGWMGYLLTPERLAAGLATISALRAESGRSTPLIASHLLFSCIGPQSEARETARRSLEARYRQPFDQLVDKYCLIGTPEACRRRLADFVRAGVRHIILSPVCEVADYERQLTLAAEELLPALPGIAAVPATPPV